MRLLGFFLILVCLFASAAQATSPIGHVKTYQPEARIIRANAEIKAITGESIFSGDQITTNGSGSVGIIFIDGAVLTLGPSSRFTIDEFTFNPADKDVSFISTIIKGTMSFISGAIGRISPESVKFKTPTATLGLRGTKILVEVK